MSRLKVVVLYGGKSTEHEVSVHSAQTVCRLLGQCARYEVFPVFIDKQGYWFLQEKCGPIPYTATVLLLMALYLKVFNINVPPEIRTFQMRHVTNLPQI